MSARSALLAAAVVALLVVLGLRLRDGGPARDGGAAADPTQADVAAPAESAKPVDLAPAEVVEGRAAPPTAPAPPTAGEAEPPAAPADEAPATAEAATRARVHGVLLDQHDRVVAHHPVLLATRARATPGELVSASSRRGELGRTETDDAGRFEFTDVPAGELVLAPLPAPTRTVAGPDGTLRIRPREHQVAPIAVGLVIAPGEVERYVELVAPTGLAIRGVVRFPDGVPAPFAEVEAWSVEHRGRTRVSANEQGEFAVGPLGEGEYALYAEHQRSDPGGPYGSGDPDGPAARPDAASWTPTRARTGDAGVVLLVTPGGGFDGRVIDAATGQGLKANVFVSPAPGSTDAAISVLAPAKADGAFRVRDVAPTLYDLYAFDGAEEGGGRVGVARGVQAVGGEDRPFVVIEVAPAARVLLRYDGPADEARVSVYDAAGQRVCRVPLVRGSETAWQVPAGALRVEFAERGGAERTRSFEVEAVAGADPVALTWRPDAE